MPKSLLQRFAQAAAIALGLSLAQGVLAAPVKVTYLLPAPPNLPAFAPWIIAKEKGYYAAHDLELNFIAAKGGVDVAKQLGAGNALIGGAMGETSIVVRANDIPVRAVALLGNGGLAQVATRRGAGIAGIADLKGKTMTVMSYSDNIYYSLLASLRKVGLGKNDVDIQAAGPSGVWQLFAAGKAQAMAASPDWVTNVENAGVEVRLIPLFESMAQAILASDKAIREQPELVRGVVQATLQGMRDVIQDPRDAARVFVKAVPAYAGKEEAVERVLRLYVEHVYASQQVLGHIDPQRMEQIRQFYVSEGIVSQAPRLEDLYTNQFIDSPMAAQ
ncbi:MULTISPECIES: ABC transporter substrate-binding protein [unclassified Pseudomonas]|uniref:ABC transporter substrate-binding protein n=1 Tax=unclassified Pseudomonas TaxID=196821 RepID=UPI000A1FE8C4|nr:MULTISPECIES: ABC transporter substrate-binding protein [unclassified Pseudomonas]POA51964.1 ABC transporter substrate-binding protein [Pseudomonas sp. FW507-12TSA]